MNYYNDNDPKACAWLRELIAQGHLPPGTVDERSILEIEPIDLAGFDQCHFFAGIGGWPLALRWAGLEGVAGIWTGSCPCQPLSCAGKRQGHADERHLWPAFYRLIAECRPATIFGEQVASKDGREWFAGVRLDLEDLGYACGGADLCAAGVGAPHRRQRLFWVADADCFGHTAQRIQRAQQARQVGICGATGHVADADHAATGRAREGGQGECQGELAGSDGACGLGDAMCSGRLDWRRVPRRRDEEGRRIEATERGQLRDEVERASAPCDWSRCDILPCWDGKARCVESQPQQMADGVSAHLDALRNAGLSEDQIGAAVSTFPLTEHAVGRTMLLRGMGNAIIPQLAAQFILAWRECV